MGDESVYLDANATTRMSPAVEAAISDALMEAWGNPSSANTFGARAKTIVDDARADVAAAVGADPSEIIFMSGGTEANNSVIRSTIREFAGIMRSGIFGVGAKPHVVTSAVEHDAILMPLDDLELEEGAVEVTRIPVNRETGAVDPLDVLNALRPTTILVTFMLANNETGVIFDIPEIFKAVGEVNERRARAKLPPIRRHTDAAQAIGKIPVNVVDLHADYLTIVGHKFYGPRIGALYVRRLGEEGDDACPFFPMLFGGGQERGYRPGTENTPMIAGLGIAAREVAPDKVPAYEEHMLEVREYLESRLKEAFGAENLVIHFEKSRRLPNTANVSFSPKLCGEMTGKDILQGCRRLVASTSAACHTRYTGGSKILTACGVDPALVRTAVRLSVGRSTTKADIDVAVEDLKTSIETGPRPDPDPEIPDLECAHD